jgi:hypothetical protein
VSPRSLVGLWIGEKLTQDLCGVIRVKEADDIDASLLALFCDFTADKRYQVADWRIRPLPHEMLHYARVELECRLLGSLEHLPNEILFPLCALEQAVAKLVVHVEPYDAERGFGMNGWRSLLKKQMGHKGATTLRDEYGSSEDTAVWGLGEMGQKKERVFKRLHAWRDTVARSEDESPLSVSTQLAAANNRSHALFEQLCMIGMRDLLASTVLSSGSSACGRR